MQSERIDGAVGKSIITVWVMLEKTATAGLRTGNATRTKELETREITRQ